MIWSWFIGSRLGRALAAVGAVVAALGVAFLAGVSRQKQTTKISDLKAAAKTTAEVSKLEKGVANATDADLVDRLTRRP